MSAVKPWMKFYPQDWRADEKLRLCSLAARGLWMEMLAIMHRSERYGQLLISGRVPTDAQLAVQVGASPPEVAELLGELEAAGVFSRASSGAIYSRRMTRDHRKAETARKNGKTGGNPSLCKEGNKLASVKGSDNGGLKPQRPEARGSVSNETGGEPPGRDVAKSIFDLGLTLLKAEGMTETGARKLIGSWRKGGNDAAVEAALLDAQTRNISKLAEWMPKRLAGGGRSELDTLMAQAHRYKSAA